jgi:hypothetical protein
MVTAILAVLAVALSLDVSPASARRSHQPDLFRELFGPPVRLRGTVHGSRTAREPKSARGSKSASEPKSGSEPKSTGEPTPVREPKGAPDTESARERREAHEASDVGDAKVPLPQPRPAEAPKTQPDKPLSAKAAPNKSNEQTGQTATATPAPTPTPAPPSPSACRLALTEEVAVAPSVPDIHGPGACGGEDLVRLETIVLPNKHRVSLKPAATMRCAMAATVADWVRTEVQPLAQGLGTEITELENFDAYECRGRNGISGAQLSEHGLANAIDVHAFKLANGQSLGLTDRDVPRPVRESVLHSACARFTTVLGPGSDGYHEDHIHLDLRERHNNYKICQWNVWDPLPQVAPLMPEQRPDDAPPRQVADKNDDGKPEDAKSNDGKGSNGKGSDGKSSDKANGAREAKSNSGKFESNKSESNKPESDKSGSAKSGSLESGSAKSKSGKADKSDSDEPATKKRRHGRRS